MVLYIALASSSTRKSRRGCCACAAAEVDAWAVFDFRWEEGGEDDADAEEKELKEGYVADDGDVDPDDDDDDEDAAGALSIMPPIVRDDDKGNAEAVAAPAGGGGGGDIYTRG